MPKLSPTRNLRLLLIVFGVVLVAACASAPTSLSPAGVQEYHADQVVQVVNAVVASVKTANRAPVPIGGFILADRETAIILGACDGILAAIQASSANYVDRARGVLVQTRAQLTPAERARVAPYLERLSASLDEVRR